MASSSNEVTNTSSENDGNNSSEVKQCENNRLTYQCNICFNHLKDPVVTKCGHLYCWPCMHQWLQTKPNGLQVCPVCRRLISQEEVIPILYRIGTINRQQDPRKELPVQPPWRHDVVSDLNAFIAYDFFRLQTSPSRQDTELSYSEINYYMLQMRSLLEEN